MKSHAGPTMASACVVFKDDHVLLVAKKHEPLAGQWGFPGGKINSGETILTAAKRECFEETGIKNVNKKKLSMFVFLKQGCVCLERGEGDFRRKMECFEF